MDGTGKSGLSVRMRRYEQRTQRITTRFTPTEEELLVKMAKAAQIPHVSGFVRNGALLLAAKELSDTDALAFAQWTSSDNDGARDRAHQLKRIGGNVNQIATQINHISNLVKEAARLGNVSNEQVEALKGRLPSPDDLAEMVDNLVGIVREEEEWIRTLNGRRATPRTAE